MTADECLAAFLAGPAPSASATPEEIGSFDQTVSVVSAALRRGGVDLADGHDAAVAFVIVHALGSVWCDAAERHGHEFASGAAGRLILAVQEAVWQAQRPRADRGTGR